MTIENGVRAIAGIFVLASLAMGTQGCPLYVSRYWLFFTAFIGFMLVQSAFTGICPAAFFLKKLGLRSAPPQPSA